jgi:hypothetical protein
METKPTPLLFQIPRRYAGLLEVDPSFLWRVNVGERLLGPDLSFLLLDLIAKEQDPELRELRLEDLRPEMVRAKKYLCKGCKLRNAQEK